MVDLDLSQQQEESSNFKIAKDLMNLEKDLEGKTELRDEEINLILRRFFFNTVFGQENVDINLLNQKMTDMFMRLRVSKDRKGRSEAVDLGKSQDGGDMNNKTFWKSYFGLDR